MKEKIQELMKKKTLVYFIGVIIVGAILAYSWQKSHPESAPAVEAAPAAPAAPEVKK